jgi:hypothetical protein
MSTTPNTVDLSTMTAEQKAELFSQLKMEEREVKTAKSRAEKYSKFPMYNSYRAAVTEAKKWNDTKKKLLGEMKALGFGVRALKSNGTTPSPSTKGTTGKKK